MVDPFLNQLPNRFTMKEIKVADDSRLILGITTRHGGISNKPFETMNMGFHVQDDASAVLENRQRLAKDLQISLNNWVGVEQVHSITIRKVTQNECGLGAREMDSALSNTDGLYTRDQHVLLTAYYADCVPLYFFSKKHAMIGLAHAGWRGTVGNIAGEMIQIWSKNEMVPLEDIEVVIGPSIDRCCYEVDQNVIDQVMQLHPDNNDEIIYSSTGLEHYMLDLKELNRQLLHRAGISKDHIHLSSYCTSCRTDLFYSHRKEYGKTGRMLGYIGLF